VEANDCRLLQGDLEIGVLGHRQALLSAIRHLPVTYDQAVTEEPRHHQPAADSPESPLLKARLHRQKLLRELEKAQAHSAALHRSASKYLYAIFIIFRQQ